MDDARTIGLLSWGSKNNILKLDRQAYPDKPWIEPWLSTDGSLLSPYLSTLEEQPSSLIYGIKGT